MITAHITKVKDGWKMSIVNGVKPILENIITEVVLTLRILLNPKTLKRGTTRRII